MIVARVAMDTDLVPLVLLDRRVPTGGMKRSGIVWKIDEALTRIFTDVRERPGPAYTWMDAESTAPEPAAPEQVLVIDAQGFPPEGNDSLARALVDLTGRGFGRFLVSHARGHRFLGAGLGPESEGISIEIYGSSGDYIASGLDGAEMVVHGAGQDQLAQIMKSGKALMPEEAWVHKAK